LVKTKQRVVKNKFTKLLKENQGIVHKICNIYFFNRIEKEDYFQEIVIELWKAFPNFKEQSKFSTWMYRVALNTAIDLLRKEKTQPKFVSLSKQELALPDNLSKEISTKQEILHRAINLLSSVEKAIIILYLEDYSYKEIAEIIGISETYTGVKINRIKVELQIKLNHGNTGN
jgi:RNA polymerase sigma-70 factor, ECF subfamily